MSHERHERPLGELAALTIGRTPARDRSEFWTADLSRPFCSIADMQAKEIVPSREGVTQLAIDSGSAKRAPAGTLLMSFKLSVGRVGFAGTDLYHNEAIVAISPHSDVSPEYLYWALRATRFEEMTSEAVKGKTLNLQSIKKIPVPVFSTREQRRIVDLLASADSVVDALGVELASKTVLRDALIDDICASPARRVALSALVTSPPRPMRSAEAPAVFRYAALADVKRDRPVRIEDLPEHSFESSPSRARLIAREGDSVVPTVGIHNRGAMYVSPELDGVVVSTGFCVLRPAAGVDPEHLWAVARSSEFIAWGRQHTRGTTLPSVNAKELLRFRAPASLDPERLSAVSAADQNVRSAKERLDAAKHLRDQLLHDLLSGAHRIPESYDRLLSGAKEAV